MGILDIIVPHEKIARQEFETTLVLTGDIRYQIKNGVEIHMIFLIY